MHTATIDSEVKDGDAKVWGRVENVMDEALQKRYVEALFVETGFDLGGQTFEHFFRAEVSAAAAVEVSEGHLDITVWREGGAETVIRKH